MLAHNGQNYHTLCCMSVSKNSKNLSLDTKRHSFAHLMAAAVKQMFPEARFGVGPVIENGCFYDFVLPRTLIPEDLELIEEKINGLLKRNLRMKQQEMTLQEALSFFDSQKQPLKVELLLDLQNKGTTSLKEEEREFIGEGTAQNITLYRLEDEDTGEDLFVDLCRGPHIVDGKDFKNIAFKLDKFSAAYWRGDQQRNISMQRIYALVFDNQQELDNFLEQREEAKKRDHRILGQQLEIFTISEDVGSGLPIYLPNGAKIRQLLEKYCLQEAEKNGYKYVYTPHIGKSDLFQKSGHLDHYADGMFAPINMVNLKGEGAVDGKVEQFYLKPMNCPMHHQVYLNKPRSYKDLPIRLYEYGTVYRYEESGTLTGMIRVRGFTQNDSHIYCTPEQITEVFVECLTRFQNAYEALGIKDYRFRFSLPDFVNDKEKYGEETVEWQNSIDSIQKALDVTGIPYFVGVGEAAFYGPKIDVQVKNVNGKEDTLSTIQVDMSIAPKFNISYTNTEGQKQAPAILHVALMGSVDRFMAFMLEMNAGRLPFWIAPTQVKILTVNDQVLPYVEKVKEVLNETVLMKPLKYNEIRFEVDDRSESLGKKIREAEMEKIPVILIVGPKDMEAGQVSVRTKDGESKVALSELKDVLEGM